MMSYTPNSLLNHEAPAISGALHFNGQDYELLKTLRHLQGRRSTLLVREKDSAELLVLKLFIASGKGQREFEHELSVHSYCCKHQIPVADIRSEINSDNGVSAIAYLYLPNATEISNMSFDTQPIDKLFELFATCHLAGCYQDDPHLGNFVLSGGKLYLLDLASVVISGKPVSLALSLKNIASLLVQWPEIQQPELHAKLPSYFTKRALIFNQQASIDIQNQYQKVRQHHQRHYLKKQLRNCTMTEYKKSTSEEKAWRRGEVQALSYEQLEANMDDGKPLKLGNSATVIQSFYAGQEVVIKRYNMKSFWHFLRRCLRPSRARTSWLNANLLNYVGIATPKPLGFLERRILGLRHRSYYVCSNLVGKPLLELSDEQLQAPTLLKQIGELFFVLRQNQIVHGDMKANNLLVDEDGKLWLIDLDAMRQVKDKKFNLLHEQDKQRFMANWNGRDVASQINKVMEMNEISSLSL